MNNLLFLIAFLEGFTTLSVEIMSIRHSVSIIGANSISTSIILGIILVSLSYGYYRGGVIASNKTKHEIKQKIYINLLLASLYYIFLSFPLENIFLEYFLGLNFGYFVSIFISILLLFFVPVFLASQTIPLLSELVKHNKKSEVIGKLLFFSTIGSFFGSILTSLVFFPYIGVINSIIFNSIILSFLSIVMLYIRHKKFLSKSFVLNIFYFLSLIFVIFIDKSDFSDSLYSFDSPHNDIKIYTNGNKSLFTINGSYSSGIDHKKKVSFFPYINDITSIIDKEKPKKILVIGAAGFSLPQDIAKRDYVEKVDVCDIDGSLYEISQKYFLREKLDEKISFFAYPARYFLNQKIKEAEKYDFIFVDAYHGRISIPSQLLTLEFFNSLEKVSSGVISMNLILDSELKSDFFKKLSNTLYETSSDYYIRQSGYGGKHSNFLALNKNIYGYSKILKNEGYSFYYDNKNTLGLDKYKLFYR